MNERWRGYVKLWRTSFDNKYYFQEPFTRWQAWTDLLLLANHATGYIRKRGIEIPVKRGQLGDGEEKLAERWKWSRGKVRRFLHDLEKDGQVKRVFSTKNGTEDGTEDLPLKDTSKTTVNLLIEITNYNSYQGEEKSEKEGNGTEDGTENSTEDSTENGTRTRRNKNNKNNLKDACPEPKPAPDLPPAANEIFLCFPTNKKDEQHPILKADMRSWSELYPAVNIEQEIRNMLGWLKANPAKRKTTAGIPKFINTWLKKEQDKGGKCVPFQKPQYSDVGNWGDPEPEPERTPEEIEERRQAAEAVLRKYHRL